MLYEKLLRPLLFCLDAEVAHGFVLTLLKWTSAHPRLLQYLQRRTIVHQPGLQQDIMGMRFSNPVGLAAGFDKDGIAAPGLAALGFGFLTLGTVTPRNGQPGNAGKRLFRDPLQYGMWNRLGFNNHGAYGLARVLAKQPKLSLPLGISLGKAAGTPLEDAFHDYCDSLRTLYSYADFFEICISSPNTRELRTLQQAELLGVLLRKLVWQSNELAGASGLPKRKPLWPKFAPDMCPEELEAAVHVCCQHLDPAMDALIMGNSTIDPRINPDVSKGGYSGRPLFPKTMAALQSFRRALSRRAQENGLTVVGCGGVFDGEDVYSMMKTGGCRLVQLHSAFPYRGPLIVPKILEELTSVMQRTGTSHVSEIMDRPGR